MSCKNPIVLLVMVNVIAAFPVIARGSLPVEYAMVGCIKGGKFYINEAATPTLAGSEINALEGKTIRVEGYLSPGDRFDAISLFVVDDQCRSNLHKTYFLCDPCRTMLDDPPSRPVPRKEKGVPVQASPEAIKQFNNLPHLMRGISRNIK